MMRPGDFKQRLASVEPADRIFRTIASVDDGEAFVVGGAIRDAYLGRDIRDLDIFIAPSVLRRLMASELLQLGRVVRGPLGSPRWFPRPDLSVDLVPINRISHGYGLSRNFRQVLPKLDLTINAIAIDLRSGAVCHNEHSFADLESRTARLVRRDAPNIRFSPGSLLTWRQILVIRVKRLIRKLELNVEPRTHDWLTRNQVSQITEIEYDNLFVSPFTKNVQQGLLAIGADYPAGAHRPVPADRPRVLLAAGVD